MEGAEGAATVNNIPLVFLHSQNPVIEAPTLSFVRSSCWRSVPIAITPVLTQKAQPAGNTYLVPDLVGGPGVVTAESIADYL